jgi:Base plate wedge protein 53
MGNYFQKFPIISYGGVTCRNIMSRVALSDVAATTATVFYPYTVREDRRMDAISYDYYADPDMVWLIALTNGYSDLYYDWPLPYGVLQDHIAVKYGSLQAATQKIVFWRNNWVSDDSNITPSDYDALPSNLKKYWNPQLGFMGNVSGYVRKPEDWIITTNQMASLTIEYFTSSPAFQVGERIMHNGTFIGVVSGINSSVSPTQVVIQDVMVSDIVATLAAAAGVSIPLILSGFSLATISGATSGATATVSDTVVLQKNIQDNEASYWSPVYASDYELELNEQKRSILLLDNKYSSQAKKQLKTLLQQ